MYFLCKLYSNSTPCSQYKKYQFSAKKFPEDYKENGAGVKWGTRDGCESGVGILGCFDKIDF